MPFGSRHPVIRTRPLFGASALCGIAFCAPLGALAHAYVVGSQPQAGERLSSSPAAISVSFDEPVTIESGEPLTVRDSSGVVAGCVPNAGIDARDETRLICRLARPLGRGAYTVGWRVTSADTHVVHGEFSFGVGEAAPGARAPTATTVFDPASPLAAALRFAMLYPALIACGAYVFAREILKHSAATDRANRRCKRVVVLGVAIALAASIPALAVQAIAAAGSAAAVTPAALAATALDSAWGHAWLARSIGLAALGAIVRFESARIARFAPLAIATVLTSFSLSGHARDAIDPRFVVANVIADVVHAGAAAVWSGGVVAFIAVRADLAPARAIEAFSPYAFAAALAIVLSGTYASAVHVGSLEGLVDNTYGLLVLAKIVLLVPLLALGFRNMSRGNGSMPIAGSTVELRAEATLFVLLFALSAILTGVAPAARSMPPMSGMH